MRKEHVELLSFVAKLLEEEDLVCLIHYGSSLLKKKSYGDIDLVAVCKKVEGIEVFHLGPVDLFKINPQEQRKYVEKFDPIYGTEPLLSGEPILGDKDYFNNLEKSISDIKPNENALDYLTRSSFTYYIEAWQSLARARRSLKEIRWCEDNLHFFVLFFQVLLFFAPLGFSILIFGISFADQQLLSLIVMGLSINAFWIVEVPLLTKANLSVTFELTAVEDTENIVFSEKYLTNKIVFEPQTLTLVRVALYNLGFNPYRNGTLEIYFGKEFEIVPCTDPIYKRLDFYKTFTLQKRKGGVLFSPMDNFQSIPPQEYFMFPVIVRTPKTRITGHMVVLFFSENSWGLKKIKTSFRVGR